MGFKREGYFRIFFGTRDFIVIVQVLLGVLVILFSFR